MPQGGFFPVFASAVLRLDLAVLEGISWGCLRLRAGLAISGLKGGDDRESAGKRA